MRSIFENGPVEIKDQNNRELIVRKDGFSLNTGKKEINVSFRDIRYTNVTRYCNSNNCYMVMMVGKDGNNVEFDTDLPHIDGVHNILETKTILTAFAASRLGNDFPNNLRTLDIELGHSLKEKLISISNGVIKGAKNSIRIDDIHTVKCVSNGALTRFAIYTGPKKKFFNTPDFAVVCNELTAPLLEAIVTRNTGKGIDFSRGNGFDQKTSEFAIIRYMDSDFFINEDGTFSEKWQEDAYYRIAQYGYDIKNLLSQFE